MKKLPSRPDADSTAHERDAWDQHWDSYHESADLNPAQDYRRRLLREMVREYGPRPPVRLLDIGSGPGDFAREFLESFPGAEVLGLEYSRTGVEIARSEVPAGRFLQRDLLQPQEPEAADRAWANLAVCSEVLEHVDEPARLLGNARPYLADGARVLITVPGGPMSYFDRHIGHRRHFSRAALAEIIVRAGYRVRGVWGAGFPFFNLYKLAVIARGQGLVKDASPTERGGMGWPVQVAMKAFNVLFKLNLGFTPLGWQIVAVAEASERRDGM